VYAPLLADQADDVVHLAPDLRSPHEEEEFLSNLRDVSADQGFELPFGDLDEDDEELFKHSKKYLFGDYNYPCVDVSSELARTQVWDEEERILRDERGAYFSPILGPGRVLGQSRTAGGGYGAVGQFHRSAGRPRHDSNLSTSSLTKGKVRESGSQMREAVIDRDHDRVPDLGQGEVKLRWTKSTPDESPSVVLSPPIARARTLSSQHEPRRSSVAGSPGPGHSSGSGSSTPRDRQPPPSPHTENERPVLPPDAVDLVVEDRHAGEENMTRERRKGEPAVRGGPALKKVYKRGYAIDSDEEHLEGEVEVGSPGIPDNEEERGLFSVGDDVDAIIRAEDEAVGDVTIARVETPPAHARIFVENYHISSEDNPWA